MQRMALHTLKSMSECTEVGISIVVPIKRGWLSLDLYPWRTTTLKDVSFVKLIEPLCTEQYAWWFDRLVVEIIAYILLDC